MGQVDSLLPRRRVFLWGVGWGGRGTVGARPNRVSSGPPSPAPAPARQAKRPPSTSSQDFSTPFHAALSAPHPLNPAHTTRARTHHMQAQTPAPPGPPRHRRWMAGCSGGRLPPRCPAWCQQRWRWRRPGRRATGWRQPTPRATARRCLRRPATSTWWTRLEGQWGRIPRAGWRVGVPRATAPNEWLCHWPPPALPTPQSQSLRPPSPSNPPWPVSCAASVCGEAARPGAQPAAPRAAPRAAGCRPPTSWCAWAKSEPLLSMAEASVGFRRGRGGNGVPESKV